MHKFDKSIAASMLYAAEALKRAHDAYMKCKDNSFVSFNSGPLYETCDNLDTSKRELDEVLSKISEPSNGEGP